MSRSLINFKLWKIDKMKPKKYCVKNKTKEHSKKTFCNKLVVPLGWTKSFRDKNNKKQLRKFSNPRRISRKKYCIKNKTKEHSEKTFYNL